MQYPVLGFKNAEKKCLLREEVEEMLQEAARLLPDGLHFILWDAWRPFALQEELFISYSEKIIRDFHLEDVSKEEQVKKISQFVANPIRDEEFPPAHTTGGAVDVTIADADGNLLEMGTGFDAFSVATRAAYYESKEAEGLPDAEVIRNNRRMLYHIMKKAGFSNLPSEWWHYEFGDMNWAHITGQPAKYRGIFTLD